jgi:hypothetical protein
LSRAITFLIDSRISSTEGSPAWRILTSLQPRPDRQPPAGTRPIAVE